MAVDTIVTKIRTYKPTLLNEAEAGARTRGDVADWHGSCQSTARDENQSAHSELPNILVMMCTDITCWGEHRSLTVS
jgi:hypothetical protein